MTNHTQTKFFDTTDSITENNNDSFKVFYKSISVEEPKFKDNFAKKSKQGIIKVMKSLPFDKLNFDELNISSNREIWIKSLLLKTDTNNIKFLMNDFTDEMNTTMREKNKYVILILMKNELILVHTKLGEKSLSPKFKFYDRMLDKDNIMRYVWFKKNDDTINVQYYEKYQSKFFTNWLGVNQKDLFYEFGGTNKFYLDLYGYPLVLEIDDEDFEENDYFKFNNNLVTLKEPAEGFKINHIQRASKRYENIHDFEKDYTSRRFNLKYHQEKYNELMNSLIPLQNKIYDYETCVKSTNNKYYLQKVNTNLTILFCNDKIDIDEEFLDSIILSIINNGEIELCHAGLKMIGTPIIIRNFKIYNDLSLKLAKPLIDYYNTTDLSSSHKKEFLYVIFHCLYQENQNSLYCYFLRKCTEEFSKKLTFSSNIYENEIIELKSRDFLPKKTEEIIENLSKDINKKILHSDLKFYILGYDEKTRTYEPFSSQRFPDDRINNIKQKIKEKTKVSEITLFKMDYDNKNCILTLIVKK